MAGENHEIDSDGCGAHYYIYRDGTIYQCCSHGQVGAAGCYTQKHPYVRIANTIGIEMCCKCDGNSASAEDSYWYFIEETQEACVWFVQKLLTELGIPSDNVLRHYDIVNKTCPALYVHNNGYKTAETWDEFKDRINGGDSNKNEQIYMATMSLARQLLDQHIIFSEEYRKIDTIFAEKYGISLGRLFSDISLIQ